MNSFTTTTTTTTTNGDFQSIAGFLGIFLLIVLALSVFGAICAWRVFTKAGKPGWAALVPIYNIIVLLEIIDKPWWWIFGLFLTGIPVIGAAFGVIFTIIIAVELANKFGKSTAFGVIGLWMFNIVGYTILAFGPAQYNRNAPPLVTALTGSGSNQNPTYPPTQPMQPAPAPEQPATPAFDQSQTVEAPTQPVTPTFDPNQTQPVVSPIEPTPIQPEPIDPNNQTPPPSV